MPARATDKSKGKQRQVESEDDEMQVDQNGTKSAEESEDSEEEPDMTAGDTRTAQQQRETRRRLRDHASKVADAKTNAANVDVDTLIKLLNKQESNFKKIRTTDELTIDAAGVRSMAEMGYQKARQMRSEQNNFDCQDWLYKVRRFLYPTLDAGDDADDDGPRQPSPFEMYRGWTALGYLAAKHTQRVPAMDFMMGPLAIEPKKRKERDATQTQRKSQKISEKERVVPTEVTGEDVKKDEHATGEAVRRVRACAPYHIIKHDAEQLHALLEDEGGDEGVSFFEFMINPDSYSQTIENIFHLSFLVKSGKAGFNETDDNDQPFADGPKIMATLARDAAERSELQAEGADTSGRQVVLEMTEALWKEAIELFDIKSSKIPTRKVQQMGQQASGWYA